MQLIMLELAKKKKSKSLDHENDTAVFDTVWVYASFDDCSFLCKSETELNPSPAEPGYTLPLQTV